MKCVLIALLAVASARAQSNPWNYVPADATSITAFEWRRVLDSPQRELVRREIPPAASQLMNGINFIEGIDRVIVAQTGNSTLLILNGKFEPGQLRDMALSDGGSVKAYRNAELLVASNSTEGGTQIALVGEEIVLLGDREALVASIDRAGSGKHAASAGQYDLWLEEKPASPDITSVEFALLLKDGVQLIATVHARSPEAAKAVLSNSASLGLNVSESGNDVRLSALFPPAQFEQRAGQWRIAIEQLASTRAERILPTASPGIAPPPVEKPIEKPDGPRKVKIIGLEEGEREIDLNASPLPGDAALTKAEMDGETAWLASLGVNGSPLLEHPFAAPVTKRSFIVPRLWYVQPGDKVSADALRKDLPVLRTVMEKTYGGWDSAEKRGWKWSQWFADWDKMLAENAGRTLAWSDALAPFMKLADFQLDNQSGPMFPVVRWESGSQTAVLQQSPAGICSQMRLANGRVIALDDKNPAQQPHRALLGDLETLTAYISYPDRLGEVNGIACGGKWIDVKGAWNAPQAKVSENVPSYRMISKDIGYLRPGRQELPETAGNEKLLIVDLRGNNGLYNPVDAFLRWDLVKPHQWMPYNERTRQSCVTSSLRWGSLQQMTPRGQLNASDRKWMQGQLDELMKSSADGCPVKVEERKVDWNYRKHQFSGKAKMLVVVDKSCRQECEFVAYMLSHSTDGVIAGVNTFGSSQFFRLGRFILPYSRLPFRLASSESDFYGDQRSFDGYGFNVDVLLPTEQSQSTEAIVNLAERLLR
jgi:hypothetical protein